MSKYISVGNAAVSVEALKEISGEDKIRILDAMFNGCGLETDNHGQLIQYTELMYAGDTVVPLVIDPPSSDNAPDPYEVEEESEPISTESIVDETEPPTLRMVEFPIPVAS